jgi:hypothetical protein
MDPHMILQRMPKGVHLCMLYATAMLLGEDAEKLLKELGVKWDTKLWPYLEIPQCYRGVSMPEIQDLLMLRKRILATVALMPVVAPTARAEPFNVYTENTAATRGLIYIQRGDCLIEGIVSGQRHCVACDGSRIYDPTLGEYHIGELGMSIESIHLLCKVC